MTESTQQGAYQRGLASAQIAIEIDDQPGRQPVRQFGTEAASRRFVGQFEFGGNIAVMHEQVTPSENAALAAEIRRWGHELGFAEIGFARAEIGEAARHLQDWLAQGYHGEMDYMARHAALRSDPSALVPGTICVITAALDYLPTKPERQRLADGEQAIVSCYALGRDYHKVMRSRLKRLAEKIAACTPGFAYRVFSDSAPVMEVEFAQQTGLGWRGKHTLLLSRRGSWRFLGEIYCNLPLPPDSPQTEHCGSCTACLDACPTGAIFAPYRVDARRCISYLTIEHPGSIPVELRPLIGNRIYGCDDCQLCCPWNRFARTGDPEFAPRNGLDRASLLELFAWDAEQFEARLAGSPIRRIGHERWLRNIAVALGNAPFSQAIVDALSARIDHSSEVVGEHVKWALERQSLY